MTVKDLLYWLKDIPEDTPVKLCAGDIDEHVDLVAIVVNDDGAILIGDF